MSANEERVAAVTSYLKGDTIKSQEKSLKEAVAETERAEGLAYLATTRPFTVSAEKKRCIVTFINCYLY